MTKEKIIYVKKNCQHNMSAYIKKSSVTGLIVCLASMGTLLYCTLINQPVSLDSYPVSIRILAPIGILSLMLISLVSASYSLND